MMFPMEELSRRQKMTPEQRERERETQKRWYLNNIDKIRAKKREAMKRFREENLEFVRERQKRYRNKNIEHHRQKLRTYTRKRFFWAAAMHLRKENRANYKELASLYKSQRGICALTGRRLTRGDIHLDHILPLSLNGDDTKENLQWVCKDANLAKRALTNDEFIKLCQDVVRTYEEK